MKTLIPLNRRHFLGGAMAASTTACSVTGGTELTDAEMKTLTSVCDQMVPPDQDPGGAWAGVSTYIARQLRGFYRGHIGIYRSGLAEADRRAGGDFAGAPRDRQLAILTEMDNGIDGETHKAHKRFIALVAAHSIQGFYGSPRHGGNRDYCSWRMLGVAASPVRGRDPYDFSKDGGA